MSKMKFRVFQRVGKTKIIPIGLKILLIFIVKQNKETIKQIGSKEDKTTSLNKIPKTGINYVIFSINTCGQS